MQSTTEAPSSELQGDYMCGITEAPITLNHGPLSLNSIRGQTERYLLAIDRHLDLMDEIHREMYGFVREHQWPRNFGYDKVILWYNIMNHHKQYCRLLDHLLKLSGIPKPEGLECAEWSWLDTALSLPEDWYLYYPFGLVTKFLGIIYSDGNVPDPAEPSEFNIFSTVNYLGYALYCFIRAKGLEDFTRVLFARAEQVLIVITKDFLQRNGITNPSSPLSWLSIKEALSSDEQGSYVPADSWDVEVGEIEYAIEVTVCDDWTLL